MISHAHELFRHQVAYLVHVPQREIYFNCSHAFANCDQQIPVTAPVSDSALCNNAHVLHVRAPLTPAPPPPPPPPHFVKLHYDKLVRRHQPFLTYLTRKLHRRSWHPKRLMLVCMDISGYLLQYRGESRTNTLNYRHLGLQTYCCEPRTLYSIPYTACDYSK
jgi:hypothetical protein